MFVGCFYYPKISGFNVIIMLRANEASVFFFKVISRRNIHKMTSDRHLKKMYNRLDFMLDTAI